MSKHIDEFCGAVIKYVQKHLEETWGAATSLTAYLAGFFPILADVSFLDSVLFTTAVKALLTGFFGGLGGLTIKIIWGKIVRSKPIEDEKN
ncbi:hypothetical protein [Xanthovirga aplysinae]|uniref:hypothetical protein n=1 Tax=Xanthovirga aplysinae TaxID=2529853 RepID=UPI0012BB9263|nr:hypothetical protein [Xanthovirga aplysinae]MTI30065.1 hypothetical protein [Xanthovirga aplysinae]